MGDNPLDILKNGLPADYAELAPQLTLKVSGWFVDDVIGGDGIPEKPFDKRKIFPRNSKHTGRLDTRGWAVCAAISATLEAAGLLDRGEDKLPVAIYYSDDLGSQAADVAYFKDYLDYGETGGRANLFVHTLPSSPLGEASVRFGLTGETAYFAASGDVLREMLTAAADAVSAETGDLFLIGAGQSTAKGFDAVFAMLQRG